MTSTPADNINALPIAQNTTQYLEQSPKHDSLSVINAENRVTNITYGLVIHREDEILPQPEFHNVSGTSWVICALFAIFIIICLRVRNSKKYIIALVRDLSDVRERHNAFDETVRETSLLFLLNIFWSGCAGVLLYSLMLKMCSGNAADSLFLPVLWQKPSLCIAVCSGVTALYTAIMCASYFLIGNVFTDSVHTKMWVKGFAAQQGLTTVLLFPLALITLCYPELPGACLTLAAIVFFLGKLIFICKGIRIFFAQFSSWVLFLYYLCSLEIVPLILTFLLAWNLCSVL